MFYIKTKFKIYFNFTHFQTFMIILSTLNIAFHYYYSYNLVAFKM